MSALLVIPLLSGWAAYVAIGVAVLTVVLLAVLLWKYLEKTRKAKNTAAATASAPEAAPVALPPPSRQLDASLLKAVFRRGVRILKRQSTTRDPTYDIPWVLMIGPPGAGKSTILSSIEPEAMKPDPSFRRLSAAAGCDWAFLSQGVIIEVAGDYLYQEGDPLSRRTGWGRLLSALRSWRKARPLDGIVLVLPANELLRPGAQAEVERELLARRILERLQALQRRLGVRVPVYVVVSRCDAIQGFDAFAKYLPEGASNEMIGWSTPYSVDATYRDDWLVEAFTSVETNLAEVQLATLSRGGAIAEAGELFLFRSELVRLRHAVTTLISGLFKGTVYLEPYMLRGLYFVGDPDSAKPSDEPRVVRTQFAHKLFSGKVLAETGLARLGSRAYSTRVRAVRTVQIVFALICLGFITGKVFATRRVLEAAKVLQPVLNSMRGGDTTVADASGGTASGTAAPKYSRSFTVRLLDDMSELNYGGLRSVFLPSSFASEIDQRIQSAVTSGYEGVIFPAFVAELRLRSEEQLAPVAQVSLRQVPGASVEQTPAFGELQQRIEILKQLLATAEQYKGFVASDSKAIAELNALCEKLLEHPLPNGFYANYEYQETALKGAGGPEFKAEAYQEEASKMARTLVAAIYASVFNATELTDSLRKVEDELDRFSRIQVTPQPSNTTVAVMRDLAAAITEAESLARRSKLPMLLGSTYEPGEQFTALLETMRHMAFFPPTLSDELEAMGRTKFDEEYERLYKTRVKQFDSLLERRLWSNSFGINPRVLMLRDALEGMVNAEYMSVGSPARIKEAPGDNMTLLWDVDVLERARRVAENYDLVRSSGFNSLGPELSKKLAELAEIHALDYLTRTVASAQRVDEISADEDEGDGSAEWQEKELANFKRAEPILSGLVAQFRKMAYEDLAADVQRVEFQQAGTLLGFADIALASARPYGMAQRNFAWWNGEAPPAIESFGLTDALELKPFVSMQRQVVRRLARDRAQPLVELLQGKPLTEILGSPDEAAQIEETLERWVKITSSLKLQEAKQPGNPVDALESFILGDMTKVSLANCFDPALLRDVTREPGEYFGDLRERLRYSIYERCNELSAAQARLEFDLVRREFEPLVNKFPFLNCPFDADPVKVKAALDAGMNFIKKHEKTIATNSVFLSSRSELVAFMERVKKVNEFFGTTLTVDGPIPSLSFDTSVAFRINRTLEVGALQVIDWRIKLNRFEADLRSKEEERMRWGLSDRVELSFRWATQAPDQPTKEGLPGSARVEGGGVTYTYAGPWALLRLIRAHLAPQDMLENPQEPSHPLVFRVETERNRVPKDEPDFGQRRVARLFVRAELYSPITKARLTLPDFPECVPDLDSPGACEDR